MKRHLVVVLSALAIVLGGSAAAQVPGAEVPSNPALDRLQSIESPRIPGWHGLLPDAKTVLAALPGVVAAPAEAMPAETTPTVAEPGPHLSVAVADPAEARSAEADPAPAAEPAPRSAKPAQVWSGSDPATGPLFPGLPNDGHAAYTSGTAIHADALETTASRLANVDVAFSGASHSSALLTAGITNEMERIVSPALKAGGAFGRGSGLEAGLASPPSADSQVILSEKVEALAPPSTGLLQKETTLDAAPAAVASLLRGEAQGIAGAACTTGIDLSYGLGYAADVALAATGADASLVSTRAAAPLRSDVQSRSATRLIPQSGEKAPDGIARFGMQSETRQTIAPITFLAGTEAQFTLELLGEWVLRTTADGREGKVHYGPGTVSPETPVLRVLDQAGEVTRQLKFQELFGNAGLVVPVGTVAKIVIGEDPRAIGGDEQTRPAATPTLAAAAVDVARVELLAVGGNHAADIRVGHMESAVAVPEDGIKCGIGVVKDAIPRQVNVGDPFKWAITVSNPNDCTLQQVKLVDDITATGGVLWTVNGSSPKADEQSNSKLTWLDLGPIGPGKSKDLTIDVTVKPESAGGRFTDTAVVTAICGPDPADANANAGAGAPVGGAATATGVPLEARVTLNLPDVLLVVGAVELPAQLPRTGVAPLATMALGLCGAGLALRGIGRRRHR